MEFELVSRKVVKPSKPTPVTLREYKFSFFDQLSSSTYPGYIFLYPNHPQVDNAKRCEELEKSLSHTLSFFYMMAGTFVPDQFLVICDDSGVEVTHTRVHGDLVDMIDHAHRPNNSNFLESFVPPCTNSVLAVHMTSFSCGGLGLGLRILHSISDGFSVVTFLNHWSTTNRLGVNHTSFVPSFELASIFPRRELVGLKSTKAIHSGEEGKLVTKCFLLNSSMISALKTEATRGGKSTGQRQREPSTVLVVTAHVWRTLIRVRQAKHGYLRPSLMSTSMNLRPRITSLNLARYSWGTFVSFPSARFTGDEQRRMGLSEFVDLLIGAMKKDIEEFSAARNGDEFYSKRVKNYNELRADHNPLQEDLCRVTSWCGFSLYESADFGWEKPSRFFRVTLSPHMTMLVDTNEGDGIELWVNLVEQDMEEFERHVLQIDYCNLSAATNASSKL